MFNFKFKDIYIDRDYRIAVDFNNKLYGCGVNDRGALGGNVKQSYSSTSTFEEIDSEYDIQEFYSTGSVILIKKSDGKWYFKGSNTGFSFGSEYETTSNYQKEFTLAPNLNIANIKSFKYNNGCLYIINTNDELWVCGYNSYGHFGLNDKTDRDSLVKAMDNVKDVYGNAYCTFIVKNDGTLWACGWNEYGQLGLGDKTTRTTFTQVTTNINVGNEIEIYCGNQANYLHDKTNNTLWACGRNNLGQLGLGDKTTRTTFTQVNIDNIKKISVGPNFVALVKNDGTLWTVGYNATGQLGLGDTTNKNTFTQVSNINNVKNVFCYGNDSSFIVLEDGSILATGYNYYGQLGLGDTTNRNTFTQISNVTNAKQIYQGSYNNYIVTNDNKILSSGYYSSNFALLRTISIGEKTFVNLGIDDVKKMVAHEGNTIILKNDNTLWAAGYNGNKQLGVGDTYDNVCEFIKLASDVKDFGTSIHAYNIFIIKNDGTVWVAGANWCGEAGLPEEYSDEEICAFIQVPNINDVKYIAGGCEHALALKNDGTVWATGANWTGQLGTGDEDGNEVFGFVQVPNVDNVKELIVDEEDTYIIKNDNSLWGTGANYYGELGLGDDEERYTFVKILDNVKKIYIGNYLMRVLKDDGSLWGCGYNTDGELGVGTYNHTLSLTKILDNVKEVFAYDHHSFAITNNNKLYGWGGSPNGELGLGDYNKRTVPVEIPVDFNVSEIKKIVVKSNATHILLNDGTCYYSGYNFYHTTGDHPIKEQKDYYDTFVKYGPPANIENAFITINGITTNIEKGSFSGAHEIIIDENNNIFVRGDNDYGQLGLGDTIDRNGFVRLDESNIEHIKAIRNITVIKKDGQYYIAGEHVGNKFIKFDL